MIFITFSVYFSGDIAYQPLLLNPIQQKQQSESPEASSTLSIKNFNNQESTSNTNNKSLSWSPSRRLSHETLNSPDSGFFNGVPTPPSSYTSSQSASPYSAVSLASPQSSYPDLYSNVNFANNNSNANTEPSPLVIHEDLDFEKIVDDVDNMYR